MKCFLIGLFISLQLFLSCSTTRNIRVPDQVYKPDDAKGEDVEAEQKEKNLPVNEETPVLDKSMDTIPPPAFKIDTIFSVSYGPCYGKCEVYRIHFTNDGMVFWNGINHVDKKGQYITQLIQLQKEELETWITSILNANLKDSYPEKIEFISDFPTRNYTLKSGNKIKLIEVNHSPPALLVFLEQKLKSWLEQADWRRIDGK